MCVSVWLSGVRVVEGRATWDTSWDVSLDSRRQAAKEAQAVFVFTTSSEHSRSRAWDPGGAGGLLLSAL